MWSIHKENIIQPSKGRNATWTSLEDTVRSRPDDEGQIRNRNEVPGGVKSLGLEVELWLRLTS